MKKQPVKRHSVKPIIRLRSMLLGVALLALLIAGPLLVVWKQVYITGTSLRMEKMSDSLVVLTREMTQLRLQGERLASTERIERIARHACSLDYPSSDQIVIVTLPNKKETMPSALSREFMAFLKRSLFGDRT